MLCQIGGGGGGGGGQGSPELLPSVAVTFQPSAHSSSITGVQEEISLCLVVYCRGFGQLELYCSLHVHK